MSDLWEHQKKFIELCEQETCAGALMRPGSGKTRAMIEVLRKEYNRSRGLVNTLIFAPPLPCTGWKKEFAQYSKIPDDQVHVLTMSGEKRAKLMDKILHSGKPAIVITNYEAVQIKAFYELLLKWSPDITVLDESHRVKDSGGVRARKIYPLTTAARRRFIMTGTLTPNSLLDMYGQIKAMNPALLGPSFWQFRSRYFFDKNASRRVHGKFHIPDWQPFPDAAKMLGGILSQYCVQAGEAKDLPELLVIPQSVELGAEQRRAYKSMLREFVAESKGVTSIAEFAMTKSIRLRQILLGFLSSDADSEPIWFDDVPRLDALRDILDSLSTERVIIWTEFAPTYKKLGQLCDKLGRKCRFITGNESIKEKLENKEAFINGEVDTIIANPAAAGEGTDGLQIARYAIYYAKSYNALHFDQSSKRNHRGGSEMHENVVHYHLEADGTLDQEISQALIHKRNLSEAISFWISRQETLDPRKSAQYGFLKENELCQSQ